VIVLIGLIVYFWHSAREILLFSLFSIVKLNLSVFTAEQQGILDPQQPEYIKKRQAEATISGEEAV
jgi:hypothetical protein